MKYSVVIPLKDEEGNIEKANIFYSNGRIDIIRYGKLLRTIENPEFTKDYLLDGRLAREITSAGITHVLYVYDEADTLVEIQKELPEGTFHVYDTEGNLSRLEKSDGAITTFQGGVISEIREALGNIYKYQQEEVTVDGETFIRSFLNTSESSDTGDKTPLELFYSLAGELSKVTLIDSSEINFKDGLPDEIYDAEGNLTTIDYLENSGLLDGLILSREGVHFEYDQAGFLSKIETASGTLEVDGDEITRIFLPDGSIIEDFIQDDLTGDFITGTFISPDGTKRFFEDGKLVRIETTFGEVYETVETDQGTVSYLIELHFHDGTVAYFDQGELDGIEFSDGGILQDIVIDDLGFILSATEVLRKSRESRSLSCPRRRSRRPSSNRVHSEPCRGFPPG